ncbi:NADP:D-xylose dehydrogenase [Colletotrichum simmondsii]|uniref:D-xylose 1-dehydrogenase (NADP(+), D-xylono-1,5-lactone-forming) n=1 Tax=Colletotrichum simmondsii TaxID=703756 RepID=A0A135RYW4_9PEZI|nr:NADP:D-xylose dehydrogenase [Colletotrichum simmondsii]
MSEYFCRDLLTNPATREVTDVKRAITAVSSSKDPDKAIEFLARIDHPAPTEVSTFGSYAALVRDPNVDIVYIATPHSHHIQNAMLALHAGKSVLCEKALTVTAAQARRLGAIGQVYRVTADLSRANGIKDFESKRLNYEDSHRMANPDLAGGVLLGLGIYPLTWVFQILYHLQPKNEKEQPQILSAVQKYSTGVDESATIILHFPEHGTVGIATSSLRVATDPGNSRNPAIRIQGSHGEIQVEDPAYKPQCFKIITTSETGADEKVDECPQPQDSERSWGNGTFWEADEAARCIRDGKLESDTMPWSESILIMEIMDKVLEDAGIFYPELIATDEFDPLSPLNTGG